MLRLLFPRLTAEPARGAELFGWVTGQARQAHWYVDGQVPDTVDGRFGMLATIAGLALVRVEREDDQALSAALTERFVEAMDAEHREMGLGDPTLGRTVRKLVGSLARRVELWRRTTVNECDWAEAVRNSVYRGCEPVDDARAHSVTALRSLWTRLDSAPLHAVAEGTIG